MVLRPCCFKTKRGRSCPINGDRNMLNGRPVCHVHDPRGVYQLSVEAERALKFARRNAPRPAEPQRHYTGHACPIATRDDSPWDGHSAPF